MTTRSVARVSIKWTGISHLGRCWSRPGELDHQQGAIPTCTVEGSRLVKKGGQDWEPGFSQTEMCEVLSEVNGDRSQSDQRCLSTMPANLAIKSSSDGHTYR